ncbi:MAG: hypothetical protein ABWY06_11230 [Pseudomonas sp.]|uniref:hypothetical protein n=1 Tax=Pseudomonas sp. TaxID=306 RepID=UPI00339A5359
MLIKLVAVASLLLLLTGCATPPTYIYGDQTYYSPEAVLGAIDIDLINTLASIQPLPAPLTQRKLIYAVPSESIVIAEAKNQYIKNNRQPAQGAALISLETLATGNYKSLKLGHAAVDKRNIYSSVQWVTMQAMTGEFPASPETDVLYYTQASQDSGQWFYVSYKHGKQIFAHDRSAPESLGKINAFIEAVQAQAIRE